MILEMLGDGKWHEIEELQLMLGLNEHKVQEITTFLNKYDFVKIDKEHRKVKINQEFPKVISSNCYLTIETAKCLFKKLKICGMVGLVRVKLSLKCQRDLRSFP